MHILNGPSGNNTVVAKYMRNYFQTSNSEVLDFFNYIMGLCERPRRADAELHFLGQPRHCSAICLGKTGWAQSSPARLNLQQVTSFAFPQKGMRQQLKMGEYPCTEVLSLSIALKTIQYLCSRSQHCQPTDAGFLTLPSHHTLHIEQL